MFGVSNTVPDRPKNGSYGQYVRITSKIYGECVRSQIKSARAKIFSNYASREPIDAMRQWGEKVNFTLVRDRGVDV